MDCNHYSHYVSRRELLSRTCYGLGATALGTLLGGDSQANAAERAFPNFAPKAKRVIFLFQAGGPSHLDLFDYKPGIQKIAGEDLPDSVRQGQRLTAMT